MALNPPVLMWESIIEDGSAAICTRIQGPGGIVCADVLANKARRAIQRYEPIKGIVDNSIADCS